MHAVTTSAIVATLLVGTSWHGTAQALAAQASDANLLCPTAWRMWSLGSCTCERQVPGSTSQWTAIVDAGWLAWSDGAASDPAADELLLNAEFAAEMGLGAGDPVRVYANENHDCLLDDDDLGRFSVYRFAGTHAGEGVLMSRRARNRIGTAPGDRVVLDTSVVSHVAFAVVHGVPPGQGGLIGTCFGCQDAPNRGAFRVLLHPVLLEALGLRTGDEVRIHRDVDGDRRLTMADRDWAYYLVVGTWATWPATGADPPIRMGRDARNRIAAQPGQGVLIDTDTVRHPWEATRTGLQPLRVAKASTALSWMNRTTKERLCLPSRVRRELGLREPNTHKDGEIKQQVRVYVDWNGDGELTSPADDEFFLFTVISECDYLPNDEPTAGGPFIEYPVHMGKEARARLDIDDGAHILLAAIAIQPGPVTEDASIYELLSDNGTENRVIFTAPHGGHMEVGTAEQARRAASALGFGSQWQVRVANEPMSLSDGHDRYHITSADIDATADRDAHPYESFLLFPTVAQRGFQNAVSFHGFSYECAGDCKCASDHRPPYSAVVEVGGGAPRELRQDIADEIARRLAAVALPGHCIDVSLADPTGRRAGTHVDNFINWLATDGIQIEQSYTARRDYGDAIADGVAAVYAAMYESEQGAP